MQRQSPQVTAFRFRDSLLRTTNSDRLRQRPSTGGKCARKCVCHGVGLYWPPTASVLATQGYDVLGVDVKPEIVNTINEGKIHIVEPDLDALVQNAVSSGQLRAALAPATAHIFIIAVPTPFLPNKPPTSPMFGIQLKRSHPLFPQVR